jgi:very-short-patch-repair endonuclease
MNSNRTIAPNVLEFLDKASAMHGRSEEGKFQSSMYGNLLELGIASPIEDLFWIALNAMCAANWLEVNPGPEKAIDGSFEPGYGIHATPQAKIGNYRVDFLISQYGIGPDEILVPVIVELDGHAFHDKDKRQRSYEKARDRFLQKEGYKVLHFTGSDVAADPFLVAHEVLGMLGGIGYIGDIYDPENPLAVV